MKRIYLIGTVSFENDSSDRELKSIGGISGYLLDLLDYMLSQGFHVTFVGKIYNYSARDNLVYIEIQKRISGTNLFLVYLYVKSIFIRVPKDAIVHAHRPDHYAAFMAHKSRKSGITLHGQASKLIKMRKRKAVRFIYFSLERYAFRKSDFLIAVDDKTKDYYSLQYPDYHNKILVIPTGVDTRLFTPNNTDMLRRDLGYSSEDKIVVYAGRVEPPKRLDTIVRAFQKLVEKSDSYKLLIVGDGVSLKETELLAEELNLNRFVKFLGIRKRIELPEIYNLADISVLYSWSEGSPLSVKESLACGTPVVANAVGDIPKVITNGINGYIVEEDGITELSDKMELCIKLSKEMNKKCVDSVKTYAVEKVNKQMADVYLSIFNG